MTTEGKPVIGGVFPLVNSEGILLEVLISRMHDKGYVIDWHGFWKEAMENGWNPRSTVTKIATSVGEVLGPEVREGVERSLRFLHELEEAKGDGPKMLKLLRERRREDLRERRERLIKILRVRSSDG